MAKIKLYCPDEVGVDGTAHIGVLVEKTLPFEFDVCADDMEAWFYVNDKLTTKIPLLKYVQPGNSFSFEYQVVPKEEGEYRVRAVLKGAGSIIPPGCVGTAVDECSFIAVQGAPQDSYPPGWEPPNWFFQTTCILPFVCVPNWLLVGGVALGAMYLYSKYEEQKEKEEMMYLALL